MSDDPQRKLVIILSSKGNPMCVAGRKAGV
jgi:hypothetical protein